MTPRLQLIALGAAGAVLLLGVIYGMGRHAGRVTMERDAERIRVETIKDAERIEDETDALARDGDALRRELDRRLSRPGPR